MKRLLIPAIAAISMMFAAHRSSSGQTAAATDNSTHSFFVVFLGTGMPAPNPHRQGPSLAIVANGKPYIVDAGVGLVRQAQAAARERGIGALSLGQLDIAFVTHLHSDHTLGLPDLIFTPWLVRTAPLQLYGPVGTKAMADNIEKAYAEDIYIRTHAPNPLSETGHEVVVHEIQPGVVYSDDNVKVTAFAVRHGIWKEALGYRFDAGGKSIVISGDTAPAQSVVEACRGCDILVHEAYFGNPGTAASREYFSTFHTSAEELGAIAAQAHPKLLVLDHTMPMEDVGEAKLLEGIRQKFQGPVIVAEDLDVIAP